MLVILESMQWLLEQVTVTNVLLVVFRTNVETLRATNVQQVNLATEEVPKIASCAPEGNLVENWVRSVRILDVCPVQLALCSL